MRTRLLTKAVRGCLLPAAFLLLLFFSSDTYAQTFTNPIRNTASPDPTMVYYNGNYYIAWTGGTALQMAKAPTLEELKTAPAVTVHTAPGTNRCCRMWAPALRRLNNKWYLYFAADDGNTLNHRNWVLESTTDDPMGPYIYKGQLFPTAQQNAHAIDGNVLQHDNGSLYFCWASAGRIAIAAMSNPWTISSATATIISTPTLPWEKFVTGINENPSFLKKNGKTFLMYSASHCESPNYAVGMLTNTDGNYMNPGSWVKTQTPVFKSGNGVYGTGGQDFFKSPDGREDWMVYHATHIATGNCGSARTARLGRVSWLANGNPYFHSPSAPGTPYPMPGNGIIIPDGVYRLTNVNSNKAMTTAGCSGANSAVVEQSDWNGQDCQRWHIVHVGDGFYKITSRTTGRALDNTSCIRTDGNKIQLSDYRDDDCQKWKIVQVSTGVIKLVNRGNGSVLDVAGNSTANGADVVLWSYNSNTSQQWQFNEVSSNFIAEGTYRIRLEKNNKVLQPAGGADVRGSVTVQSDWVNGAYQLWTVRATTDGWYRVHTANNFALDVDVCNSTQGGLVQIWDSLNNNCQRFGFSAVSGGRWALVNRNSKKVLNSPGTTNGAAVNQWTWAANANQIWFVEAPPSSLAARTVTPVSQFSVTPNPIITGTELQVTFRSNNSLPAVIIVYDILGRPVQEQRVQMTHGYNRFNVATGKLIPGTYNITISVNGEKVNKKIMVN